MKQRIRRVVAKSSAWKRCGVSYELEIVREAMESLAQLENELQEDVLDELERVIDEPFSVVVRGGMPGAVREVVRRGTTTLITSSSSCTWTIRLNWFRSGRLDMFAGRSGM
jgi:hypothetical protein